MNFIFEQIRTGGDRNFGYLVGDRKAGACVFVDPSYQPILFLERAKSQGLKAEYILNTHGHFDHVNGNEQLQQKTGAKIAIHRSSAVSHDIGLENNQMLKVGAFEIKVLHVPGHSQDHVVFYIPHYEIAITGDHLFVGKIGGTSTEEDAKEQYESFEKLYKELPLSSTIWPGHDYGCRPSSTLALEKENNPFLILKNFEEFMRIKANWPHFKREHGLI